MTNTPLSVLAGNPETQGKIVSYNPYMVAPKVMNGGDDIFIRMPLGYTHARRDVLRALPDAVYSDEMQAYTVANTKHNRLVVKHTWPSLKVVKELPQTNLSRAEPMKKPPKRAIMPRDDEPTSLYDFQKVGVQFLANRGSAILADEMGLGKTVQAIVAATRLCPKGRKLVVVPATLVENWVDEIEKWTPDNDGATVYFIVGGTTKQTRLDTIEEVREDDNCWLVVSWEVMRMHATPPKRGKQKTGMELMGIHFGVCIADEAHRMKNRKALQTLAIKGLNTEHRFALTGTPIMNRPDELWSLLHWMEPKVFTSYWRFFEDFVDYQDGYFGKEILGSKNEKELGKVLAPRMIRRLKSEVFTDLPPKIYKTIYVDLLPEQQRAYDEMVNYFVTQLENGEIVSATAVIAQVIRLKQICVSLALLSEDVPHSKKIDALMEMVEGAGNQKMVVFSQFSKATDIVHDKLVKEKIPHAYLTGSRSFVYDGEKAHKKSRGDVIKWFQKDAAIKLFVGTTQAGGVGITLTAAQTVVFLDKMWTPADQAQAEDRLHRIGQRGSVYVVSLLARNTVEEHIENMLKSKSSMIASILEHARKIHVDEISGKPIGVETTLQISSTDKGVMVKTVKKLLRRSA